MGRGRKREIRRVKLVLEAGRATQAPPVWRDLGPHGINPPLTSALLREAADLQKGSGV